MKNQIGLLVGVLLVGCAQSDPSDSTYFPPAGDTPSGDGGAGGTASGEGGGGSTGLPGDPTSDGGGTTRPGTDGGGTPPTTDGGTTPPGADGGTTPTNPGATGGLIQGLSITEIAMFQGSKVDVELNGTKSTPKYVPVVAGRPGLMRVYVSGTTTKPVTAELTLTSSAGTTKFTDPNKVLTGASTDGTLSTTFNFDLPAGALAKDTTYLVRLVDPSTPPSSATGPAQYPQSGTPELLGANSDGDEVTITIVPVLYGADGSNRAPDTSAAQVKIYTDFIYQTYPVAKLNVVVHAPHPYSAAISATDTNSWSNVLDDVLQLRQTDNVADNNYYYGIFSPAATLSAYCRSGCILGIAPLTPDSNAKDTSSRGGVGAGYSGLEFATTMAQEIGHACGINHAPYPAAGQTNAPQSPDPNWPSAATYSGAHVGQWGYGFVDHMLYDPATYRDFMSYASSSIWVSDYVEGLFFKRFKTVNNALTVGMDHLYRRVSVHGDGSITVGKASVYHAPPIGTAHSVSFLDANGATVKIADGAYFGLSNGDGGYLLVAEPDAPYKSIRIDGPSVNAIAPLN